MKFIHYSKSFLLFLSGVFLLSVSPVFGQEDEPAEPAPAEEAAGLTQGQAALIIARRLGIISASSSAQTQANAAELLEARGVTPQGGWDLEAQLDVGQLARILVQALGLEAELSEAQIAGDDDQPFIDLLTERYGVDVGEIVTAADASRALPGRTRLGSKDDESSDPLKTPPTPDDTEVIPLTPEDLNTVLGALVGEEVGGGAQNITPSAP